MKVSSSSRRSFLTTSLLVARPVLIAGSPPGLQSASQIKAGRRSSVWAVIRMIPNLDAPEHWRSIRSWVTRPRSFISPEAKEAFRASQTTKPPETGAPNARPPAGFWRQERALPGRLMARWISRERAWTSFRRSWLKSVPTWSSLTGRWIRTWITRWTACVPSERALP